MLQLLWDRLQTPYRGCTPAPSDPLTPAPARISGHPLAPNSGILEQPLEIRKP